MLWESACGKIILFGEHAVVYGRPALAVPLPQLRARAGIQPAGSDTSIIHAHDLGRDLYPDGKDANEPLAVILGLARARLGITGAFELVIESDIPLASGLGSGAAVATAVVRALAGFGQKPLPPAELSALVFETEKLYHGTPSGIDNTVIAYEQPVRFVRRVPPSPDEITPFIIAQPFTLVIANTGIASPTKETVGDVRRGWNQDRARYESIFDAVRVIVGEAQDALARGENSRLGELLTRNQRELERMGVSSPALERLIDAGCKAGAAGGKLSGGGRGGSVIFYVAPSDANAVSNAVAAAGAARVLTTVVG